MSFLAGWQIIAIAAGLTIPPLVALYFLKLKRRVEPIPSTLLWKRAVEDFHVNAPFQRLRRNLLLLLQLLVLLLAAFALGKPIIEAPRTHEGSVILMIDNSASMNVEEANGKTRLDLAKEQARRIIDNFKSGTRAMIITFNDKAAIISSFDTDRSALKAAIDAIQPTQSLTTLAEALALAEAHASNLIVGGELVAPNVAAGGRVLLLTDGRVADAGQLVSQRFQAESMEIINVARRADNVGIVTMEARRQYETPQVLEVFATVRNFGTDPVGPFDITLTIDGRPEDVQTVPTLRPGLLATPEETDAAAEGTTPAADQDTGPPPGSVASVAFDEILYEGGGVVEVNIRVDDALAADNHAWTVIAPPRGIDVLLVTAGNTFLERALQTLPIRLTKMTPAEYENAEDKQLLAAKRLIHDVAILDRHSTDRLPPGNYMFWEAVPAIEGVNLGEPVTDEVIVNWDETHPILRHVAVESIQVALWRRLAVPPEAVILMDGESAPVMAYLSRDGREYLISAFGLIADDPETGQPLLNTFWVTQTHFPMFMYNAVQFLAAAVSTSGLDTVRPGEPVMIPVAGQRETIVVRRPDGTSDEIRTAGSEEVPYANTRRVGVYQVAPGVEGRDTFAVNLFNPTESNVAPNRTFTIGADLVAAGQSVDRVHKPIWPYLLIAALAILLFEWIVYNKRVFV